MGERAFPPIADHGVVGDLSTAALVALDGSIDFLCWPRFDSPTIFAALLDPEVGGRFSVVPQLEGRVQKQMYIPDTNVLLTRTLAEAGELEVVDFLPVGEKSPRLIRVIRAVRSTVRCTVRCAPRFDYARSAHTVERNGDQVLFTPSTGPTLRLSASVPLQVDGRDASCELELAVGETATFVLQDATTEVPDSESVAALYDLTVSYWQEWSSRSTYRGRWRETVQRSALLLKLLSSRELGSIVAAPTFGLPERIGGGRNWDYRYTWIRDAAFTLYALMRLGYTEEAEQFMGWLQHRARHADADGTLQVLYAADETRSVEEVELEHLSGYRDSKPARIGNGAHGQLQLDIYGELMDAVYLASKYGRPISHDAWASVTKTLDWVCENWRTPDQGIWEVRGGPREFLHSRLMCWVAVDRGLRLAEKRSLPADFAKLVATRNAIHADIFESFWDDEAKTFVQYKGGTEVDASTLLMPLVRFISPTDPRWLSTLDAIGTRLSCGALVRRYDVEGAADDGLAGDEGYFTTCSFWYVECLARAGRLAEARVLFEKMLGYANPLGLYAEELGHVGEHLGNFPQALTHLALISAAYALNRELDPSPREPWSR